MNYVIKINCRVYMLMNYDQIMYWYKVQVEKLISWKNFENSANLF